MSREPILLDSITDVTGEGGIVVSGSHGGMFPAAIASKWQLNAVVFNDAGIGLERAGVAGVMELIELKNMVLKLKNIFLYGMMNLL